MALVLTLQLLALSWALGLTGITSNGTQEAGGPPHSTAPAPPAKRGNWRDLASLLESSSRAPPRRPRPWAPPSRPNSMQPRPLKPPLPFPYPKPKQPTDPVPPTWYPKTLPPRPRNPLLPYPNPFPYPKPKQPTDPVPPTWYPKTLPPRPRNPLLPYPNPFPYPKPKQPTDPVPPTSYPKILPPRPRNPLLPYPNPFPYPKPKQPTDPVPPTWYPKPLPPLFQWPTDPVPPIWYPKPQPPLFRWPTDPVPPTWYPKPQPPLFRWPTDPVPPTSLPQPPKPTLEAHPAEVVTPGANVTLTCRAPQPASGFVLRSGAGAPVRYQRPQDGDGDGAGDQAGDGDRDGAGSPWLAHFLLEAVAEAQGGAYRCEYLGPEGWSAPSDALELMVTAQLPRPSLEALPGAPLSLRCSGRGRRMSFALYRAGRAAPLQVRVSPRPWADFPLPRPAPGAYSCYYHTPAAPWVLSPRSAPLLIPDDSASVDYTQGNAVRLALAGLVLLALAALLGWEWRGGQRAPGGPGVLELGPKA